MAYSSHLLYFHEYNKKKFNIALTSPDPLYCLYSKEKAASIAYETVKDFLEKRDDIKASFVFHNYEDKDIFVKTIQGKR